MRSPLLVRGLGLPKPEGEPGFVTYWITRVFAEGRKEIRTSVASSAKLPWQNSDTSCINL